MDLREEKVGGVSVVEVKGRLDGATAPVLGARLTVSMEAPEARIVLDLSRLQYISSAGFRICCLPQSAPRRPGASWSCAASRARCGSSSIWEVFSICSPSRGRARKASPQRAERWDREMNKPAGIIFVYPLLAFRHGVDFLRQARLLRGGYR